MIRPKVSSQPQLTEVTVALVVSGGGTAAGSGLVALDEMSFLTSDLGEALVETGVAGTAASICLVILLVDFRFVLLATLPRAGERERERDREREGVRLACLWRGGVRERPCGVYFTSKEY